MAAILAEKMFILFAILAIGSWIGQQNLRGVSLGAAGVLFTALVFGNFGFTIPQEVMDLGLLLFVYAVGLQAGPRFFRTFRRHGLRFVAIATSVVLTGALVTAILAIALHLPADLAAGLYSGALTCTPALAAAVDVVQRLAPAGANLAGLSSGTVSVGYGISYPFSMVFVVLLVQFLPRLMRRDLRQEEQNWLNERGTESPRLEARQYLVTNPNCDGRRVSEINPRRMSLANISRIKRGERVFAATSEIVIHLNDIVMVVGSADELEKMRFILGEERQERMDVNSDVLSVDVEVLEESMTGKTLAQMRLWERYTVVITRIRRQGLEIAPTGATTLDMGDTIRVVGEKAAVEAFEKLIHGTPRKADETNMVPFLIGLLLGILVGAIPVPLPSGLPGLPAGLTLRLGSAGGAFLVSLLVGHFGGIGSFRLHVPAAAKNLSRELGLMLFLAGAGVNAGARFLPVLQTQGLALLLTGMTITVTSVLAGILVMNFGFRMNLLATMGALCAGMTNPPGLGAASGQTETELPTLSYASVYPVALIFKILLAQVLVSLLQRWP